VAPLDTNPFAILTFIAAPAILTNASSVMGLGTSNRFARAIDRVRSLSRELEGQENADDPETLFRFRQLHVAQRRALLLVRALSAFYLAVGSFAGASLVSLLGAVFVLAERDLLRHAALGLGLVCGMLGIGGLVVGAGLLVWETRLTLQILGEETEHLLRHARTSAKNKPSQ
jgi:uncharacterized protein DUF2721